MTDYIVWEVSSYEQKIVNGRYIGIKSDCYKVKLLLSNDSDVLCDAMTNKLLENGFSATGYSILFCGIEGLSFKRNEVTYIAKFTEFQYPDVEHWIE